MIIAAVETSSGLSSVAVLDTSSGECQQRIHEGPKGHVEFLMPALLDLVSLPQVDLFAVGAGPGAFTGLRVGVQTAKTLAHLQNRPLVAVSSLHALAYPFSDEVVVACMHAFRGEVFAAVFSNRIRVTDDQVMKPAEALELAKDHSATLIGNATERFPELGQASDHQTRFPLAESVARIAADNPADVCDALSLEPRYLRRSEAEIRWGETGVVAKRPDRIKFRSPQK
jgi:tRNA threonylcarbamoyladenosine biosynthesis protein TsaB